MSRSFYVVSYDIADDRRRTRVHDLLKTFGKRVQYSVFCCELSRSSLLRLREQLRERILLTEDRVLFANLGPVEGRADKALTTLGLPWTPPERGPTIV
ncbi:MAG: CRISPR-associated endonuclease Cas2 [Planctomycetota bacterium]|nr:MAG: CRISPR-associated endonuclease Cas2 [Planctomycetota bacterium]